MAYAFSVDDDVMCLAASSVVDDVVDQLLLVKVIFLRKKNVLSAVGDTAPQSDVAGVASHDLDDGASFMRGRCVTNLVDGFHSCVDSCVETDCVLCAGDVKVDCSRNTDNVDSFVGQLLSTAVGTVAADNYETFDTVLVADFNCSCDTFRCAHFLAACCPEDCAAQGKDTGHVAGLHFNNFLVDEA